MLSLFLINKVLLLIQKQYFFFCKSMKIIGIYLTKTYICQIVLHIFYYIY
jgi:hypothetical protein